MIPAGAVTVERIDTRVDEYHGKAATERYSQNDAQTAPDSLTLSN